MKATQNKYKPLNSVENKGAIWLMELFNLDVRTLLFCFILSKPLVYTMLELKK
jgi:hypothetical protein